MEKFQRALLIAGLTVMFIAYMDVQGFDMWQTINDDAYQKGETEYLSFFWTYAYGLIALIGIAYYYLAKKDLSETLAVVGTSLILVWFGLADFLYFIFRKVPIPETLPWLNNHQIIGTISGGNVTSSSLMLSAAIGIILTIFGIKYLKKQKW
jgi:multisubunit Na+/H+ antiporter MnhB subunit